MFLIGNFFLTIGKLIDFLLGLYIWVIIINALLSWFNPDPYNKFIQFIYNISEPALRPIRRMLPANMGVDISPVIVIVILYFLKSYIARTIIDFGVRMR